MIGRQARLVADAMTTDVVALSETQDLRFLDETMRLFQFRHMPVTDDGRLVGLISDRDLLRTSASSLLPSSRQQTEFLQQKFLVRDIMTRDVTTVTPDTPLLDAALMMKEKKIGCLPVVDGENALVGILTAADFLLLAIEFLR